MATKTDKTPDPRDSNRRVDFPEAGQGCYLLLRNSGTRTLRALYDTEHLTVVERAFLTLDIPVIDKLLEIMVWNAKDDLDPKSFDDFDNCTTQVLVDKVRDAWSLSLNGRAYMEQVDYIREEARRLTQDPPLTSPETETGG